VAVFAEAWEYSDEDEEDMFEGEFAEVDERVDERIRKASGWISGKSRTASVSIGKEDNCDTDWRRGCDWKGSQE
jgi:hypothetical protein